MRARVGRFLCDHHLLLAAVHRVTHRTADRACWVCVCIWAALGART